MNKLIPAKPASQSFADLERVARAYCPPGALVPPAGFAREGVSPWTLAKLLASGPIPPADSLDAVVALADRWAGLNL